MHDDGSMGRNFPGLLSTQVLSEAACVPLCSPIRASLTKTLLWIKNLSQFPASSTVSMIHKGVLLSPFHLYLAELNFWCHMIWYVMIWWALRLRWLLCSQAWVWIGVLWVENQTSADMVHQVLPSTLFAGPYKSVLAASHHCSCRD